MSQNYPTNSEVVKTDNENQWGALESLRSLFSGPSAPLSPPPQEGQPWFDTGSKVLMLCKDNGDGTYSWADAVYLSSVGKEVLSARGLCTSLAARLANLIDENGAAKVPITANISEWADPGITALEYISQTTFRCDYGKAAFFEAGRPVRATLSETYPVSTVSSVITTEPADGEDGYTTVILNDAILDNTLTSVRYAIAFASLLRGLPWGSASLGADGLIPIGQIPVSELGSVVSPCAITAFDAAGEPSSVTVDGVVYTIARDVDGRLESISNGDYVWTAQYDSDGRYTGLTEEEAV